MSPRCGPVLCGSSSDSLPHRTSISRHKLRPSYIRIAFHRRPAGSKGTLPGSDPSDPIKVFNRQMFGYEPTEIRSIEKRTHEMCARLYISCKIIPVCHVGITSVMPYYHAACPKDSCLQFCTDRNAATPNQRSNIT
jgi:hypothetical protein